MLGEHVKSSSHMKMFPPYPKWLIRQEYRQKVQCIALIHKKYGFISEINGSFLPIRTLVVCSTSINV